MQLADELPMIYTTCIIGYTTFAYGKSRLGSFGVATFFGGLAWAITVSCGSTSDIKRPALTTRGRLTISHRRTQCSIKLPTQP